MRHPLRMMILARLNEVVASPSMLAREFGEPLGVVSYHVRTLLGLDCIELVRTEPRRGAIERYYRATRRAMGDKSVWEKLPAAARRGFAGAWFMKSFEDAREAIVAGGFERRPECHLSFTRVHLDEEGWRTLSARLDEVLEQALALQAESAGRLQRADAQHEIQAHVILAQYEAPAREP